LFYFSGLLPASQARSRHDEWAFWLWIASPQAARNDGGRIVMTFSVIATGAKQSKKDYHFSYNKQSVCASLCHCEA
jgi:hypothetical protein